MYVGSGSHEDVTLNGMDTLVPELTYRIFSYFDDSTLCACERVNLAWFRFISNCSLWEDLYAYQFPNVIAHARSPPEQKDREEDVVDLWVSTNVFPARDPWRVKYKKTVIAVSSMNVWQAAAQGFASRVLDLVSVNSSLQLSFGRGPFHHASPLMVACKFGNLNVVKVLLGLSSCALNTTRHHWYSSIRRYDHCYTPLHFASDGGFFDIVQFLVEKGANKSAENDNKQKPYSVAKTEEIRKYLDSRQ